LGGGFVAALKIRIADIVFDAPARSFLLERVDMKVDAEVDRPILTARSARSRSPSRFAMCFQAGSTSRSETPDTLSRAEIDVKARRLAADGRVLDKASIERPDASPLADRRAQHGRPP